MAVFDGQARSRRGSVALFRRTVPRPGASGVLDRRCDRGSVGCNSAGAVGSPELWGTDDAGSSAQRMARCYRAADIQLQSDKTLRPSRCTAISGAERCLAGARFTNEQTTA